MPCGCGRTYIVNEYDGPRFKGRKDNSFKSFIAVMLVVLVVYLAIYCLILVLNKKNEDKTKNSGRNQPLHDKWDGSPTKNISQQTEHPTDGSEHTHHNEILPTENTHEFLTTQNNTASKTNKNERATTTTEPNNIKSSTNQNDKKVLDNQTTKPQKTSKPGGDLDVIVNPNEMVPNEEKKSPLTNQNILLETIGKEKTETSTEPDNLKPSNVPTTTGSTETNKQKGNLTTTYQNDKEVLQNQAAKYQNTSRMEADLDLNVNPYDMFPNIQKNSSLPDQNNLLETNGTEETNTSIEPDNIKSSRVPTATGQIEANVQKENSTTAYQNGNEVLDNQATKPQNTSKTEADLEVYVNPNEMFSNKEKNSHLTKQNNSLKAIGKEETNTSIEPDNIKPSSVPTTTGQPESNVQKRNSTTTNQNDKEVVDNQATKLQSTSKTEADLDVNVNPNETFPNVQKKLSLMDQNHLLETNGTEKTNTLIEPDNLQSSRVPTTTGQTETNIQKGNSTTTYQNNKVVLDNQATKPQNTSKMEADLDLNVDPKEMSPNEQNNSSLTNQNNLIETNGTEETNTSIEPNNIKPFSVPTTTGQTETNVQKRNSTTTNQNDKKVLDNQATKPQNTSKMEADSDVNTNPKEMFPNEQKNSSLTNQNNLLETNGTEKTNTVIEPDNIKSSRVPTTTDQTETNEQKRNSTTTNQNDKEVLDNQATNPQNTSKMEADLTDQNILLERNGTEETNTSIESDNIKSSSVSTTTSQTETNIQNGNLTTIATSEDEETTSIDTTTDKSETTALEKSSTTNKKIDTLLNNSINLVESIEMEDISETFTKIPQILTTLSENNKITQPEEAKARHESLKKSHLTKQNNLLETTGKEETNTSIEPDNMKPSSVPTTTGQPESNVQKRNSTSTNQNDKEVLNNHATKHQNTSKTEADLDVNVNPDETFPNVQKNSSLMNQNNLLETNMTEKTNTSIEPDNLQSFRFPTTTSQTETNIEKGNLITTYQNDKVVLDNQATKPQNTNKTEADLDVSVDSNEMFPNKQKNWPLTNQNSLIETNGTEKTNSSIEPDNIKPSSVPTTTGQPEINVQKRNSTTNQNDKGVLDNQATQPQNTSKTEADLNVDVNPNETFSNVQKNSSLMDQNNLLETNGTEKTNTSIEPGNLKSSKVPTTTGQTETNIQKGNSTTTYQNDKDVLDKQATKLQNTSKTEADLDANVVNLIQKNGTEETNTSIESDNIKSSSVLTTPSQTETNIQNGNLTTTIATLEDGKTSIDTSTGKSETTALEKSATTTNKKIVHTVLNNSDLTESIEIEDTRVTATTVPQFLTTLSENNRITQPKEAKARPESLKGENIIKTTEQENAEVELRKPLHSEPSKVKDPKEANIDEKRKTCKTPKCKARVSDMLKYMDYFADPCEDFYQFSCGRSGASAESVYSPKTQILLKHLYETGDKQLRSFQNFFAKCLRYQNEDGFATKLQQVINTTFDSSNLTTLLHLLMMKQSTPLFEVRYGYISLSEGYGLQILPPSDSYDTNVLKGWSLQSHINRRCLHVGNNFTYEKDVDLQLVNTVYKNCQKETFALMVKNFMAIMKENNQITDPVDWDIFFKKEEVSKRDIQNAIYEQRYTKVTNVKELNEEYNFIDWQMFLNSIVKDNFNQDEPIYLYMEDYFRHITNDLVTKIKKNEKEVLNTIKLYFRLQLYENLMAQREDPDQFCVNQATDLMPEIAEKIYFNNSGISDPKNQFNTVFEELKIKFDELVANSLLENDKKQPLKNKLQNLTLDFFENHDSIETTNEEDTHGADDYLRHLFALLSDKRTIRRIERTVPESWIKQNVPAVLPKAGAIVIPNTFIYKIQQDVNQPSYLTKALLTFHLSRAIALYLEDVASNLQSTFYTQFQGKLDENLNTIQNKKSWRGQKLAHDNIDWTPVYKGSMSTRTADNVALQIAFKTVSAQNETIEMLPWISDEYGPDRQFFILIAQEFCESPTLAELAQNLYETPNIPSVFRVDAMVANSPQFVDAFKCIGGNQMNLDDKIMFDTFQPDYDDDYLNQNLLTY